MRHPVQILSLATALPPHVLEQADVAAAAGRLFGARFAGFERMAPVFESAGIRRRHAVRPIDWYTAPLDWPTRSAAYLDGALDLFCDAATKALAAADLAAADIDVVVTVSSTGIATPSLDARAATRLGFRAEVLAVPLFGLGCAGGVSGLAIAARLAEARPGTRVLVVAVEVCTLAFRLDVLSKANIVATALFGDGAAAAVLQAGEGHLAVETSGQHRWPETLDIMGWTVDRDGLGVVFDRAIPPFAEAHVAGALQTILARNGLSLAEVDRVLCHPGGTKVIEAIERALDLGPGRLAIEREVLADCGNMSAPTALFVLERARLAGLPRRSLLAAMGPGFTASAVTLRTAA